MVEKVDPGTARWRGIVLQAIVPPWMRVSKEDFKRGNISKETFKLRVAKAMRMAQEAVGILKYDPKNVTA